MATWGSGPASATAAATATESLSMRTTPTSSPPRPPARSAEPEQVVAHVLSFHGSSLSGSGVFGDPSLSLGPFVGREDPTFFAGRPPAIATTSWKRLQAGPFRRPQRQHARRSA